MDDHIKIFYDISNIIRLISLTQNKEQYYDKLITKLKLWETELNKFSEQEIYEFLELHYDELKLIKFNLKKDQSFISFHDCIFTNKLKFPKSPPNNITRIFAEFIKCITFFKRDEKPTISQPVYHRLNSCGPSDDAFRKLYNQCHKNERKKVKSHIETCYIERLIYNDIFCRQTDSNSYTHQHNDFKSCFPNLTIKVSMEYDNILPIKLTISRYIKNKLISEEIYEKIITSDFLYANFVIATRKTQHYLYTKIEHYNKPRKWMRVN